MRTELNLSLTGDDAEDWLAARGWQVASMGQQHLRVTADFAWTPTFVLGRIWHTPAVLEIIPATEFEQVTVASFVLDGTTDLLADGKTRTAPVGAHFYSAGNSSLQLRSRRPSSRLLIGVPSSLFAGLASHRLLHGHSYRADPSHFRTLVASVTAALRGQVRRNTVPYRYWSVGIEKLLLAATMSGIDADRDLSCPASEPNPNCSRAQEILAIIDAHAHDPEFSVQQLAELVHLSRSQVHRVLESTDRTPALHLRDARLRLAEAHLSDGECRPPTCSALLKPAGSLPYERCGRPCARGRIARLRRRSHDAGISA